MVEQKPMEDTPLPWFEYPQYSGGGVLLYSYQDQIDGTRKSYLLLGQEEELTYDDFGGSRGKGEKHPILTAAREFYEESIGAIFNMEEITEKILKSNLFIYEANYYQYWVEITFDDLIPDNFLQVRKQKETTATKCELEKQQLRYFAVENIRKSVQEFTQYQIDISNASKKSDLPFKKPLRCEESIMRKHLIKTMLKAEQTGLLEKLEKCIL
jgi:hypothetical protein